MGRDTLLGPEGSDTCIAAFGWWCGGLVSLVPPFVWSGSVDSGWGLVGLLFEIWIVDASIRCPPCFVWLTVGWGRGVSVWCLVV